MNKSSNPFTNPATEPDDSAFETSGGESSPFDPQADMRTLAQAHKIKGNPGRHSKAKAAAKAHLANLQNVVKGK